jgi:hypothetical protein
LVVMAETAAVLLVVMAETARIERRLGRCGNPGHGVLLEMGFVVKDHPCGQRRLCTPARERVRSPERGIFAFDQEAVGVMKPDS